MQITCWKAKNFLKFFKLYGSKSKKDKDIQWRLSHLIPHLPSDHPPPPKVSTVLVSCVTSQKLLSVYLHPYTSSRMFHPFPTFFFACNIPWRSFHIHMSKSFIFFRLRISLCGCDGIQGTLPQNLAHWHVDYFKKNESEKQPIQEGLSPCSWSRP